MLNLYKSKLSLNLRIQMKTSLDVSYHIIGEMHLIINLSRYGHMSRACLAGGSTFKQIAHRGQLNFLLPTLKGDHVQPWTRLWSVVVFNDLVWFSC